MKPKTGAKLIAEERRRQIDDVGYGLSHDDGHDQHELALAAARYALPSHFDQMVIWDVELGERIWPWSPDDFKPDQSRVRNLVKAGALIAAEIDRIQRIEAKAR